MTLNTSNSIKTFLILMLLNLGVSQAQNKESFHETEVLTTLSTEGKPERESDEKVIETENQSTEKEIADDEIVDEEAMENSTPVSNDVLIARFLFFLFAVGLIILSFVAAVTAIVAGLFILIGLTSFGVISTSIIVGLYNKSITKGFNSFIVMCSAIFGSISSGIIGVVNNTYFKEIEFSENLEAYLAIGLFVGVGIGFGLTRIFKKIFAVINDNLSLHIT